MAYNMPDGVTQGMLDAELGDSDGGCEGCPNCIEPTEGELIPMPIELKCSACMTDGSGDSLHFCTETQECIDNRGPMHMGCLFAHKITHHENKEAAA